MGSSIRTADGGKIMADNPASGDTQTLITVLASACSGVLGFASKVVIDTFRSNDRRESDLMKLADKLADERRMAETKFHETSLVYVKANGELATSVEKLRGSVETLSRKIDTMPCLLVAEKMMDKQQQHANDKS